MESHQKLSEIRIVVGVDGSPESMRALRLAAEEARLRHATLEVVHAGTFRHEALELFSPDLVGQEKTVLDAAVAEAKRLEPGIIVRGRLCEPPAAEALIESSDGAAMLVVGSRGLSGLKEWTMGSVSCECAHHARCPVLVIRPNEKASTPGSDRSTMTDVGPTSG
jgi:nucleotide-binding universal stress UspA family protein